MIFFNDVNQRIISHVRRADNGITCHTKKTLMPKASKTTTIVWMD